MPQIFAVVGIIKKKEKPRHSNALSLEQEPKRTQTQGHVASPGASRMYRTEDAGSSTCCRRVDDGANLLGGDGVDVGEAEVGAVEAVGLVNVADTRVAGRGEGDVNTL